MVTGNYYWEVGQPKFYFDNPTFQQAAGQPLRHFRPNSFSSIDCKVLKWGWVVWLCNDSKRGSWHTENHKKKQLYIQATTAMAAAPQKVIQYKHGYTLSPKSHRFSCKRHLCCQRQKKSRWAMASKKIRPPFFSDFFKFDSAKRSAFRTVRLQQWTGIGTFCTLTSGAEWWLAINALSPTRLFWTFGRWCLVKTHEVPWDERYIYLLYLSEKSTIHVGTYTIHGWYGKG